MDCAYHFKKEKDVENDFNQIHYKVQKEKTENWGNISH